VRCLYRPDAGRAAQLGRRRLRHAAGSTIRSPLLLVSPEADAYFRNGRDATRTVDDPTLPDSWRLVDYTPPDTLVIELFDETLVIRTDNQDSFQGPVPALQGRF